MFVRVISKVEFSNGTGFVFNSHKLASERVALAWLKSHGAPGKQYTIVRVLRNVTVKRETVTKVE